MRITDLCVVKRITDQYIIFGNYRPICHFGNYRYNICHFFICGICISCLSHTNSNSSQGLSPCSPQYFNQLNSPEGLAHILKQFSWISSFRLHWKTSRFQIWVRLQVYVCKHMNHTFHGTGTIIWTSPEPFQFTLEGSQTLRHNP